MIFSQYQKIATGLIIIAMMTVAWVLQNSFFNTDVGWLVFAAKRLMAGGSYTKDFFEINPPMILYLYIPPVLIATLFSVKLQIAMDIYVFFLAGLSLSTCYYFVAQPDKSILAKGSLSTSSFLVVLAGLFFILPMGAFAQREHLLVLLAMPYFLLITYRLQKHQVNLYHGFFIGSLAGFGFAIKPFFLISFVLIEIYAVYRLRKWSRPETLAVMGVLLAYAVAIILFNLDYITVVLPVITHFYYQNFSFSWKRNIFDIQMAFLYFVTLFYFIRYKSNPCKEFSTVLLIALLGFSLSFFLQRAVWFYHVLPAISIGILLCSLLFSSLIKEKNLSIMEWIFLILFSVLMSAYIFFRAHYIWISIVFYPMIFYVFFAFLYSVLLYVTYKKEKNNNKFIIALFIMISASFIGYFIIKHLYNYTYLFPINLAVFLLLYMLLLPNQSHQFKYQHALFAIVGMLIFAFPTYQLAAVHSYCVADKDKMNRFVRFINPYSKQTVYFFSDGLAYNSIAIHYNQQKIASRFGAFGWAPLIKMEKNTHVKNAIHLIVSSVVEDINKNKPTTIFIDIREKQGDYLTFFLQDTAFQSTWKQYHYVKTVQDGDLYKFQIYARN